MWVTGLGLVNGCGLGSNDKYRVLGLRVLD